MKVRGAARSYALLQLDFNLVRINFEVSLQFKLLCLVSFKASNDRNFIGHTVYVYSDIV